jgi:hypothetical protein
MKTQTLSRMTMVALLLAVTPSVAATGEKGGNGGDSCEKRIQEIRSDLTDWLNHGDLAGLKLPQGVALSQYQQLMLDAVSRAVVSCQSEPLLIGSVEKTCINFQGQAGIPKIVCNTSRFMKETSESDQYVLIHHEYAGVAGLEVNQGEASDYTISNQLNGFIESVAVQKLSLRRVATPEWPVQCRRLEWDEKGIPVGKSCMTDAGSVYTRVERVGFGEAWRGPDGLIWSDILLPSANPFNAAAICSKLGGRLPTVREVKVARLNGYPDILERTSRSLNGWTSDAPPKDIVSDAGMAVAYFFNSYREIEADSVLLHHPVRCVAY